MSAYTVIWEPDAEDMLAEIWIKATDRRAVTLAQAEIDRKLAADPRSGGSHRSEGLWRMAVSPLIVYYSIQDDPREVHISAVDYRQ